MDGHGGVSGNPKPAKAGYVIDSREIGWWKKMELSETSAQWKASLNRASVRTRGYGIAGTGSEGRP